MIPNDTRTRLPVKFRLMRSPPRSELFSVGRPGDPRLGEWAVAIDEAPGPAPLHTVILLGCPDDTGVIRNRGRAGAREGPDAIRRHLYKMTPPMDFAWESRIRLLDAGNVVPGRDIEETHARARQAASSLARNGATLVLLGGGHDFAAPGFSGVFDAQRRRARSSRGGLINLDPHLDMRPREGNLPHSGTPFRDLLESNTLSGADLVAWGARACRNSRASYQFATKNGVRVVQFEKIRRGRPAAAQAFASELARLARGRSWLGVTVDIDCCADAEGASAAPVMGFTAWELAEAGRHAGAEARVVYFEIAEVAPSLEPSERSARIAAEILMGFLRARAELPPPRTPRSAKTKQNERKTEHA